MIDLLLIAPLGCDNHARTALSGPRCPGRVFFMIRSNVSNYRGTNLRQILIKAETTNSYWEDSSLLFWSFPNTGAKRRRIRFVHVDVSA